MFKFMFHKLHLANKLVPFCDFPNANYGFQSQRLPNQRHRLLHQGRQLCWVNTILFSLAKNFDNIAVAEQYLRCTKFEKIYLVMTVSFAFFSLKQCIWKYQYS